jgi:hypothetical protein
MTRPAAHAEQQQHLPRPAADAAHRVRRVVISSSVSVTSSACAGTTRCSVSRQVLERGDLGEGSRRRAGLDRASSTHCGEGSAAPHDSVSRRRMVLAAVR